MRSALFLAVLCIASAARAESVVYEHPAVKTRLTVHYATGAKAPDAVTYEGPKGFYLIMAYELATFAHGDGYSGFRYDVRSLTTGGFVSQKESFQEPKTFGFADDRCVAMIEDAIDGLKFKGKQEAPDEFANRVTLWRGRAEQIRSTWSAYEAESAMGAGMIMNKDGLDAAETPLNDAVAAIESARAERVTGEYKAAVAAPTAADPNPKADFYWRQYRALAVAADEIGRVSETLRAARMPAY
ncbi:MAG: hypothetical protein ACHQ49_07920 [Elusimicrobiota bacterium]